MRAEDSPGLGIRQTVGVLSQDWGLEQQLNLTAKQGTQERPPPPRLRGWWGSSEESARHLRLGREGRLLWGGAVGGGEAAAHMVNPGPAHPTGWSLQPQAGGRSQPAPARPSPAHIGEAPALSLPGVVPPSASRQLQRPSALRVLGPAEVPSPSCFPSSGLAGTPGFPRPPGLAASPMSPPRIWAERTAHRRGFLASSVGASRPAQWAAPSEGGRAGM